MEQGVGGFGRTAGMLARNPLGIVALFIVLVYAIAAMVLGIGGSSLGAAERILLLRFLVLFPVLVLMTFFWLVTRHHTKLYAPRDYRADDSFFRGQPDDSSREDVEKSIDERTGREIRDLAESLGSDDAAQGAREFPIDAVKDLLEKSIDASKKAREEVLQESLRDRICLALDELRRIYRHGPAGFNDLHEYLTETYPLYPHSVIDEEVKRMEADGLLSVCDDASMGTYITPCSRRK